MKFRISKTAFVLLLISLVAISIKAQQEIYSDEFEPYVGPGPMSKCYSYTITHDEVKEIIDSRININWDNDSIIILNMYSIDIGIDYPYVIYYQTKSGYYKWEHNQEALERFNWKQLFPKYIAHLIETWNVEDLKKVYDMCRQNRIISGGSIWEIYLITIKHGKATCRKMVFQSVFGGSLDKIFKQMKNFSVEEFSRIYNEQ